MSFDSVEGVVLTNIARNYSWLFKMCSISMTTCMNIFVQNLVLHKVRKPNSIYICMKQSSAIVLNIVV